MKSPFARMRTSWRSKIISTHVITFLLLQALRMSEGHHSDQVINWIELEGKKLRGESVDVVEPTSFPPVILPSSSTTNTTQDNNGTFRDDEDDEDGEQGNRIGAGAVAAGAQESNPLNNILSTPIFLQLLPQVANFVGNLASGNANSQGRPSFVGSVANLLPTPIGNQLMGLVSIIIPSAGSSSPPRHGGGHFPPAVHGRPAAPTGSSGRPKPEASNGFVPNSKPLAIQPEAERETNNVADGTRVGGTGFAAGIPISLLEGLTEADIAFLETHGLPDFNTPGAATTHSPPRSTRRPEPPSTPPPRTILEKPTAVPSPQPISQLINPSEFGMQLNQILTAQPNLAAVLEQQLQSLKHQNMQQSHNFTSGVKQEGQRLNHVGSGNLISPTQSSSGYNEHIRPLTPEQQQLAQFLYFKHQEQLQLSQNPIPQPPNQEQSTWSTLPQKQGEPFFQLQRQPIFPPFRPGPGPNIDEDDSEENDAIPGNFTKFRKVKSKH